MKLRKDQNANMLLNWWRDLNQYQLSFGFDPEGLVIREGGQYPKLRNEILMDYYTASTHDVNIGDKVI